MSGGSEPEEILRAYLRAFETLDPGALVPFYHLPCMFITSQGVVVVSDAAAALGLATALVQQARAQGYRRSEMPTLEISRLGPGLASASGTFVRLDAAGAELMRFGFTYLLRAEADRWQFVVAAAHPPGRDPA